MYIISSSEGNEQYGYDVKGNRTVQLSTASSPHTDSMEYSYDGASQLKQVTRNGFTTSYKYDGDGLMREKNDGGTTRYYYDGENIIAEGTVSGSTVNFKARYVRGLQLISMKNQWGTVGYYLQNGHGDVVNLYRQDQSLLNTYDYDIWGNPTVKEEADQYTNPFRYSGEYWDEGQQLQYLRARWYDPSVGRFITEDTWEGRLNHPDSLNPYIYVVNNPLRYVDPSGEFPAWAALLAWNTLGSGAIAFFAEIANGGDIKDAAYEGLGTAAGGVVTTALELLSPPNPIYIGVANAAGTAFGELVIANLKNESVLTVESAVSDVIGATSAYIKNEETAFFADAIISTLRTLIE